ncbi:alpha/beta hydrolase [Brevibacterium ravenspurgense]|uniref:alpha/beta fold hydrolase n=1 Tax=Brevibacterium ravenspurgense TaxID=479117 RepID=UPI001EF3AD6F|nr:alpha/beta hydrolase [Brevibacterium ravenspurgense]MCG7300553.1 alpha/beta hydrolase [Brevibacterium ravenspurgense]
MQTHVLGNGDHAVVCLSGWFGTAENWGPWTEYLDTENFSWIFLDYRGYGSRIDETGEYSLDEISADVCQVIDALEQEKITLLGHSMGGIFIQRVMLDCVKRIDSLIGISPVPPSGTPLPPELRQVFESAGGDADSRRTIIDMTTGNQLTPQFLDLLVSECMQKSQPEAVSAYFYQWADGDVSAELGVQTRPFKAIVGRNDPAVGEDTVRATYSPYWENLDVEVIESAGHYSMFETPALLAARVIDFLEYPRT